MLRIASAVLLLAFLSQSLFSQASTASLIKSLPLAGDQTKITILKYLVQQKSAEAYSAFIYYLGYGRAVQTVNLETVDYSQEIREQSALGLGALKDAKALGILQTCFEDEDNIIVQRAIINAIGSIGDIKALPWLGYVITTTRDQSLIFECTRALSKYKDDRIIQPLLEIMKGPYIYSSKSVAAEALKNVGWPEGIGY